MQIDDRYASGIHARVFARDGRTFVEDMSSTNGTLLNGATLKGEAELIDGDTVQIGDTVFRFEVGLMMLRIDDQAVPHRHRAPAQRQRGLVLHPRAAVRRRRRDGRRPGRRGRLEGGRRVLRPRAARRRRRSGSCGRRSRRPTGRSTSSPASDPEPGRDGDDDHRRDRRRSRPKRWRSATSATAAPTACAAASSSADPRPLAGRGDAAQGPAHRRPGRGPPAALDHHPRARPRTRGRGRRADRARPGRRRLPDLLRRADDDARRRADRPHLLAGATSMDAAVRALVDEANRAGGRDNITVVAFRLEDAAAPRRRRARGRDADRRQRRGGRA